MQSEVVEPLILRYRPKTFEDVIGHPKVVASLKQAVKRKSAKAYLLTGASGLGKTTLARIIATESGCDPKDISEIDAAVNTGVDATRSLAESSIFSGMFGSGSRFLIIDECHMLSSPAQQALLKAVEEPGRHRSWIFCTTDPRKIIPTLVTRCAAFHLDPVDSDDIFDLLAKVKKAEKFPVTDKVLNVLAKHSEGSPRQGLSYLTICSDVKKVSTALKLIRKVNASNKDVQGLCYLLMKGTTWPAAIAHVQALGDVQAETVRHHVFGFFSKVIVGAKSPGRAAAAAAILDAFSEPYPTQAPMGHVALSLARLLLSE